MINRLRSMKLRTRMICMILLVCTLLAGCSSKKDGVDVLIDLTDIKEYVFDAYVNAVKDYVNDAEEGTSDMIRFTLAYIDDDDIPELILSEGDYHAAGVRVFFYDTENKKAVDLGESFGEGGGFSYFYKKGVIYDYYFGRGVGNISLVSIAKDHSLTRSKTFSQEMDTQYIDYDECSLEEFEKEYEKALQEALHGNGKEQETILERSDMTGTYDMLSGKDPANAFWEMYKGVGK